jgi:VCBS repeat-containing protein
LSYTYSTPSKGAITPGSDGAYTYTPTANENGSDSFTVTISDGTSTDVVQTVSVTINAVDDRPVAESTSALSVTEDTAASGTITASEVDGQTLSYTYSTPSKGAITPGSDGAYTYTPTANENGSDSFTVTISDGTSTDVVQTVSVNVAAVDDNPVAASASTLSVTEDVAASGTITASEVDGQTLSYTYSTPSKGAITAGNDGAYTYTPTANENGSDSFTVTISDGTSTDVVQTVSVSIADVPEPQVVTASVTNEGNVYTIDFNIDQTKVASSEITSITAFSLTMDGSGSATTTDGLVDTATFGTAYAVWNSLTTGDTGLDTYLYGGAINLQTNFSKNIFTSDDTWTSTFGNASAPMVSEATTWDLSGTDIIAEEYVGSTLSIGKLVVTLEDDVTNFDIVVSGSITGTTDPTADYVNETLQSFTIDVV